MRIDPFSQLILFMTTIAGRRVHVFVRRSMVIAFAALALAAASQAQFTSSRATALRVGEKLSYAVSFENLKDAAYFETAIVSQGKLENRDVVEIRARLKTYQIVSAALALIDERRTVFADPNTGLPVMIKHTFYDQVLPRETVANFLTAPNSDFDLLTLLYALRASGGNGTFPVSEDGESSIITAQAKKSEHVSTDLGEYDTVVSTLTGPYLDARGIKKVKVNLTINDSKLPVVIQFSTPKGSYRAELTSVADINPEPATVPELIATPTPTLVPIATPKPIVTPTPYIENRPLLPELSFDLGETLQYRLSRGPQPAGTLVLSATDRKLVMGRDSLRLRASISAVDPSNQVFVVGDLVTTLVNPDTLAPIQSEMKFGGSLRSLSQSLAFDPRNGSIVTGSAVSIEAPVGTHTLLSLLYAMRSFNLRPARESANLVNDTRVAVFWNDRPYVFSLRPGMPEMILFEGNKVPAQPITINTGYADLDRLGLKVWLGMDDHRLPLRISCGGFEADLVAVTNALDKK